MCLAHSAHPIATPLNQNENHTANESVFYAYHSSVYHTYLYYIKYSYCINCSSAYLADFVCNELYSVAASSGDGRASRPLALSKLVDYLLAAYDTCSVTGSKSFFLFLIYDIAVGHSAPSTDLPIGGFYQTQGQAWPPQTQILWRLSIKRQNSRQKHAMFHDHPILSLETTD